VTFVVVNNQCCADVHSANKHNCQLINFHMPYQYYVTHRGCADARNGVGQEH